MGDDIRPALRRLRENRGFAAAAILTLAEIGAASARFGLIQSVLLAPPPS